MSRNVRNALALLLMVGAAALAWALRPTISLADELPPINLEAMVPKAFGEWKLLPQSNTQVVNPQLAEAIDRLYSQTLTRVYTNASGYPIMLSIAYGKNQTDALSLHKPEICYPAQGFILLSKQSSTLTLTGNNVKSTLIETSLGSRREPVTYWTVVGNQVVTSSTSKKLAEIKYSMKNRIPDGVIFRISSIDNNSTTAFEMHREFAKEIISSIDANSRTRVIGTLPQ